MPIQRTDTMHASQLGHIEMDFPGLSSALYYVAQIIAAAQNFAKNNTFSKCRNSYV
jgi:hypothetical protein